MAQLLARLGRWSFRHRRTVAALWVLVLVVLGATATTLAGKTSDDFQLNGIESTEAFHLIEQRAPQSNPQGATALVVFEAPQGSTFQDPTAQRAVSSALASLQRSGAHRDIAAVSDPFTTGTVSPDGSVAYATVRFTKEAPELTAADTSALDAVRADGRAAGLTTYVGGDAAPTTETPPTAEAIGVVVALVVLGLTFASLLAAGMPLLTALVGVGTGTLAITTLTGFVSLSSVTPALGSMLGLAVGIDYALFIVSRHRSELEAGRSPEDAAAHAVGTAGSAVVFAGLTVIIALVGLSVCGIGFLTQMGLAAGAMVAVAVLIALTLLPALLGFAGLRVLPRKRRPRDGSTLVVAAHPHKAPRPSIGRRWAGFVSRFRVPTLVVGVAAAAIVSIPVASLQLAIPDNATRPAGSDARIAYDLIAKSFGAGANGPLLVVVDTQGAADPQAAVQAALGDVNGLTGSGSDIAAVVPPVTSRSKQAQAAFAQQLQVTQLATITVVPRSGPSDEATQQLVTTLRERLAGLSEQTGARALVSGQTAVGVDISQKLRDVFPLYLGIVVGLAFLLLVVVFRSLLVPLKAAVGFLLSIGVSLGATVAVFQWGWLADVVGIDATSPVVFILPILLTGVLFGLAMDYEVFLVTRMREEHVHGTPARQAVVLGFEHSARVVTAAAIIMIGVFTGFTLTDDPIIKTIGFSLAVGVLADAFLVRMTLVPALMALVGERIWWLPRWLDRVVPDLDVEGASLERRPAADPEPDPEPVR